jgi:hypothetical protein
MLFIWGSIIAGDLASIQWRKKEEADTLNRDAKEPRQRNAANIPKNFIPGAKTL